MSKENYTFINLLNKNVDSNPQKTAFTFISNSSDSELCSYGELQRQSIKVSNWLISNAKGKAVLILLPTGLDYVISFLGSMYAGTIAIPAYPPRLNRNVKRIVTIVKDCPNLIAITDKASLARVKKVIDNTVELPEIDLVTIEEIKEESVEKWEVPQNINGETPAFLQYTSGSTSQPKGVIVSHRNLLENEKIIKKTFNQSEDSIIVGWLPLYHDMGLIGNILQPLYLGAECILMSPFSFLQNPTLWLKTITKYKATTSGGPNFAYDLCVEKISSKEKESIDLSSWDVAFNGAEPIRQDTLRRFTKEFSPCGFDSKAFVPCYGLAESTLLVSGFSERKEPRVLNIDSKALQKHTVKLCSSNKIDSISVVSCGKIQSKCLKIVNPDSSQECFDEQIGEIWITGASVAKGYWKKPAITKKTFRANIVDNKDINYLRTGDLGFIQEGELFITGRLKDLIIIRGQNFYPQDIERSVESLHADLRINSNAAFSVDVDGQERLVIVQETNRHLTDPTETIIEKIRQQITEEELQPFAILLVKPGSVPKTSSGKIRRNESREIYLKDKYKVTAIWRETDVSANTDLESADNAYDWIKAEIAGKIGINPKDIDPTQPILTYGIDSLRGIDLLHKIERYFNVRIPITDILNESSVNDLVKEIKTDNQIKVTKNTSQKKLTGKKQFDISIGQEALWLIQKTEPENSAYNIPICFQFVGNYDLPLFENILLEVLQKYKVLQSTIVAKKGKLVTEKKSKDSQKLQYVKATNWTQTEITAWINKESNKSFDLENEIPYRAYLIEKSNNDNILLLVFHHIAVDLWSLLNIFAELESIYKSKKHNKPSAKIEVAKPLDYSAFASKQKIELSGKKGQKHLDYWKKQLEGGVQQINFPSDLPEKKYHSSRSQEFIFNLNSETSTRIEEFCKNNKTTPYSFFLTVFKILLTKYTSQKELFIGTPTNGRNSLEFSEAIGYFVNPVIIRSKINQTLTFSELLQQVKHTSIEAFKHQEYPYPLLVEKLQPDRQHIAKPVFNVMFAMQQTHKWNQELGSLAIGRSGERINFADFQLETINASINSHFVDIALNVTETGNDTFLKINYAVDKYSENLIERFSIHYVNLLEQALINPETKTSDLQYLTEAELNNLYADVNLGKTIDDNNNFLPQFEYFEKQVTNSPDKTAIIFGEDILSYKELNEKANKLAHFLQEQGAKPEKLVGVCLSRTPNLIVTLLAILKTGAGYVPLDPAYPQERLEFIIEDTELKCIIIEDKVKDKININNTQTFNFESIEANLESFSKDNLTVKVNAENVSHLIYTSGSTGRPKGVTIRHKSVWKLLEWSKSAYTASEIETILAGTSICFDLSVYEIFVPISFGGTIVLVENILDLIDPSSEQLGITLINTVPSAMNELLRLESVPKTVSVVNLAGEALPQRLVDRLYAETNVEKVFNLYGPSEDTTYTTYGLMKSDEAPPIGKEIDGTKGYVLDEYKQPLPLGVIGELYLGGHGLARGYWNRPKITSENFVPNPFSQNIGERLYRTGDLVKLRIDGQYDYMGRRDHQVKIRGFRIELGEIEESIRQVQDVRDCVVVTRGSGNQQEIIAFVTGEVDSKEIDKRLNKKLPAYMIPKLEKLDRMPRTPNGKIDRKSLPERTNNDTVIVNKKPTNEIEKTLANIWSEVLNKDSKEIGITDNFFAVGGHSLLATRLSFYINQNFSIDIPFRTIFDYPTIEQLSSEITKLKKSKSSEKQVTIDKIPRKELIPLSPAQERLWFLDQLNPNSPVYNMPATISFKGKLNIDFLKQAIGQIIERHEILRTKIIVSNDGIPYQSISSDSAAKQRIFAEIDEFSEGLSEQEARYLIEKDVQKPFDLNQDLPIKIKLLKLAQEHFWLSINIHHIASDGWSMNILAGELSAIYNSLIQKSAAKLADLSIQYVDFSDWQRKHLTKSDLDDHLNYWKAKLSEIPPSLALSDKDDFSELDSKGSLLNFELPTQVFKELQEVSQKNEATFFITMLSAFQILLSFYSNQKDIVVGSPVAGRTHPATEHLLGLFTNTLVLRNKIDYQIAFNVLLQKNRETVLDAQQHQEVPFELLVDEIQPERDITQTPIFQYMFVMQNEIPNLNFAGLQSSLNKENTGTAKFDLTFYADKSENSLKCEIEYKSNKFDVEFIETFKENFVKLLQIISDNPSLKVSEIRESLNLTNGNLNQKLKTTDKVFSKTKHQTKRVAKNSGKFEDELKNIWAQVLDKNPKEISLNDNFFSIGGHSLSATRLLYFINQKIGRKLPLKYIFNYPTISLFSAFLEEYLNNVVDARQTNSNQLDIFLNDKFSFIEKQTHKGRIPLSFAQQRIWLSEKFDEASSYNIVGGVLLRGVLESETLEKTFDEIIIRHESLRTIFINKNGNLEQIIEKPKPLHIDYLDWTDLDVDDEKKQTLLQVEMNLEQKTKFNLQTDQLLRIKTIKLKKDTYAIILAMHHIISDGQSIEILINEFSQIYEAFSANQTSPLQPLKIQYSDYAIWIRNWMRGEVLDEHLNYWQKTLGGNIPKLKLSYSDKSEEKRSNQANSFVQEIPENLLSKLNEFNKQFGVTNYVFLMTVFFVLLNKYSRQKDIIVGTAVAGREDESIQKLIGVFINMLPIRANLTETYTFQELLTQVQEKVVSGLSFQQLPFDVLVDSLGIERETSNTPIFQVAFGLQKSHLKEQKIGDIEMSPIKSSNELARYDLTLWILEDEKLNASWTYRSALFDQKAIIMMQQYFEKILEQVIENPQIPISKIKLNKRTNKSGKVLSKIWDEKKLKKVRNRRDDKNIKTYR